jgi:hypothetical protein
MESIQSLDETVRLQVEKSIALIVLALLSAGCENIVVEPGFVRHLYASLQW